MKIINDEYKVMKLIHMLYFSVSLTTSQCLQNEKDRSADYVLTGGNSAIPKCGHLQTLLSELLSPFFGTHPVFLDFLKVPSPTINILCDDHSLPSKKKAVFLYAEPW